MRTSFKLLLSVLLGLCVLMPVPSAAQQRPKVAVVLSGGGVKGVAHVGVLRAIEEAGIPVDYIVGTSMGSIVGGLYAMGYSTSQLDSLFRHQDWSYVLSDQASRRQQSLGEREWNERFVLSTSLVRPGKPQQAGLLRGQNLGNLLARLTVGYHDSIPFDSLRIPFACVATNLSNGDEIVFRSGVLPMAIRASMAIPGVFTPVKFQGMTLVDGGLTNNYPVDVALSMGADVVIGSTVQEAFKDTTQFTSVATVLEQVISLMCRNKYEDNIRRSDLCVRIPVTQYSTMDFSAAAIDSILRRGYEAAKSQSPKLDSIRRVVGTDQPSVSELPPGRPLLSESQTTFNVRHILFSSIGSYESSAVRKACRLTDSSSVSLTQIEEALRLLRDKFLYTDANYSLRETGGHYDLTFRGREKNRSKVGAGARFDTEEMAALFLGADLILSTRTPSHFSLLGKLGEQYSVKASFTAEPALYRQLSLSYELRYNDMDINRRGHRVYNLSFRRHTVDLSYSHLRIRNFSGEVGVKLAWYDYRDVLSGVAEVDALTSDLYYTGYVRLKYNSQDKGYYPTRGSKFFAECSYTTDNLSRLSRPHGFSALMANWETVAALSPRWAILPRVSGRVLWGKDIPLPFSNAYGGESAGKYVEQQLPFTGVGNIEPARRALIIAAMKLRYNIVGRHYASALLNVATDANTLSDVHRGRYFYGTGLQYGFNSKFGPIEATFSYSDNSRKLIFYVNVGFNF